MVVKNLWMSLQIKLIYEIFTSMVTFIVHTKHIIRVAPQFKQYRYCIFYTSNATSLSNLFLFFNFDLLDCSRMLFCKGIIATKFDLSISLCLSCEINKVISLLVLLR